MPPVFSLEQLPPVDVAGRIPRLVERLDDAGCEALLVTKLANVRYLTGFTGSAGMLLVTSHGSLFVTDGRYRDQAAEQFGTAGIEINLEVHALPGQFEALSTAARGIARVGLEADAATWGLQLRIAELLERAEIVPTRRLVERLRVVKDEGERARIEAACDVADVAIAQIKHRLTEGVTEAEFAAELEAEMRHRGASGPSFETIVASGPNGAKPHARPTDRIIGPGELVVVDFGATVDGYRSDMTRTLCVGEPPDELAELVDAVFVAQRAGLRAVAEGATGGDVDAACRDSLTDAGYGDNFIHSTGHGVGLEIHEAPAIAKGSTDILAAGSIVTVEPGAYLVGRGGVRIEDTVLVGASGGRSLTKSTKDYTL